MAAAVFYVVLLIGGSASTSTAKSDKPTAKPSATVAPTTAVPSTAPTATPSAPKPSAPAPSASATTGRPADDAARDIPIGVYNNTSTPGLARTVAAKAEAVGWQVSRATNWRGQIPANTVYYPAGYAKQAELLAKDLGFNRVRPATETMQGDQLTLVLSGQQ